MQIKDLKDPYNAKVIDPKTGKIGIFKGFFETGVILSTKRYGLSPVCPVEVTEKDFLEWEIAPESEKVTIQD